MKVLVCGGRFYNDWRALSATLSSIHNDPPISEIIHGACHLGGADEMAGRWAKTNGIPVRELPFMHAIDGPWPAAGNIRNGRMLRTTNRISWWRFPAIVARPTWSSERRMLGSE